MSRTILVTGSTDGIGRGAAVRLAAEGHAVVLTGRSRAKLDDALREVGATATGPEPVSYLADLSRLDDVVSLADAVLADHEHLDVVVNNAGVLLAGPGPTAEGLDLRFAVNTVAPYLLARRLQPALAAGRVVNVSSAAQQPPDLEAMVGAASPTGGDMAVYSQSKLAQVAWTRAMAVAVGSDGPVVVAVNPGSMLATKMVQDNFGVEGQDAGLGVDTLVRAATSDEFVGAGGRYYDADAGRFGEPHPWGMEPANAEAVVAALDTFLARHLTR